MTERTMWDAIGLLVWAESSASGGVTIHGLDMRGSPGGSREYEYALAVPAGEVAVVVGALGGSADDDVVDLLGAHGAMIVTRGESSWLREIGVHAEFWSG
jgi:hypothetical protein